MLNVIQFFFFQFNLDVWCVVYDLRSDVWGCSGWCLSSSVFLGHLWPRVLHSVLKCWVGHCAFRAQCQLGMLYIIVFKSEEIKCCKYSALFIYVAIQKLIHYLDLLCVIPLLPLNAVSVKLCVSECESFKFVHYPWHYGVKYCFHSLDESWGICV